MHKRKILLLLLKKLLIFSAEDRNEMNSCIIELYEPCCIGGHYMTIDEALKRVETLYEIIYKTCFQYVEGANVQEVEIDLTIIDELGSLLNYLYELDVHDEALLRSILNKLEYGQPVYDLAMLNPISLDGNEEKIDVLYEEKIKVEKMLHESYKKQHEKLLTKAIPHLKQMQCELQAFLYICSVKQ